VYQVRQLKDNSVQVQPWPFEEPSFEVFLEMRVVRQLEFSRDEELLAAIKEAKVAEKVWRLVK
jgi:hypothetical protein